MAIRINMVDSEDGVMLDIAGPEKEVEVHIGRGVLWVNIDGVCRLRVCKIEIPVTVVKSGKKLVTNADR